MKFLHHLLSIALTSAICGVNAGSQTQASFQLPSDAFNGYPATYDAGLFTPVESLTALSETSFTSLRHPYFKSYGVRIKKAKFCDNTVQSYTGYIDIEARHLFFYFFESRSNPDKDDVILWTNGGPGCSSSLGLFMELGPCRISSDNRTVYHPEAWNTNANIFFIDQPIGVGFSYAEYGESVSTTEEAAQDVAAFVAIFFQHFTQFKGRAFHASGESYGGRYLPVFASAIYDQNAKLVEAGLTPVNLKSVMIGNGLTEPISMVLSYYDQACTSVSSDPVIDIQSCVTMKSGLNRCESWLKSSCLDQFDHINCQAAGHFCEDLLEIPFLKTGINPYDISKPCEGECGDVGYPQNETIRKFLDQPSIRDILGVDSHVGNFSTCSAEVRAAFGRTIDGVVPTTNYVSALLERGIRVLIYVGTYDWICNHVGNERWTVALEWSGQKDFASQPLRDWNVDGKRAGRTRSAKGFTFATVEGAGHMVPLDKPKESLQLIQRWLAEEDL